MKLNPKKCKEMLINFMQNDNFTKWLTKLLYVQQLKNYSVL